MYDRPLFFIHRLEDLRLENFFMTPSNANGSQSSIFVPPATPTLTFTPKTSITSASASSFTILDANASVTDGDNKLGAIRVSLGAGTGSLGVVDGTVLKTTGDIGTKLSYSYDSTTKVLSITDKTTDQSALGADFTDALKRVGYNAGSTSIGASQAISVNLGRPIYSSDNGHYYEFISYGTTTQNSRSWTSAKTDASSKTFLNLNGYLATVTSAEENKFMNDRIKEEGWIGGESTGVGNARVWKWVAGPEINQEFWKGNQRSQGGAAVLERYANWAELEPNNNRGLGDNTPGNENNEPYAHFFNDGKWNDFADNNNFIKGYWVEYSTALGTGDDGLGSTRKTFNVTVTDPNAAGTQNPAALDLVFYNPANGQISFAFVGADNNIVKAGLTVTDDTPKLAWNKDLTASTESGVVQKLISSEVDVDRDGIKDFIARNSVNGQIVVLFGENRTSTQRGYAYNCYAFVESGGQVLTGTQDWTIDFASNKLGANDTAGLLWRNAGNGLAGVAGLVATPDSTKPGLMKVVHTPGAQWLNVGANSGWAAFGDGEFNADATTREVLWRNSRTNDVTVWSYKADRSLSSANAVSFGGGNVKVGAEWTVIGVSNVDGGTNDEIVWQKGTDVSIWKMTANNVVSGALVTVSAGDRLKDVADIDKDGVLDLIGQNDTDGTVGFYTLTSTLGKKADRVTYTLGKAAYKPGKGAGNAGLELVNVAQYDTLA